MISAAAAFAILSFSARVSAQQIGTQKAEVHPALTTSTCTAAGCTTEANQVVIDANWRWTHTVDGYKNCYTGNTWDTTICPDAATCVKSCAVDGADYPGTYGITTSGNALTLKFVSGSNIGSRNYLMDTETTYKKFQLLGKEFTFDVDVSKLPCGVNGALYFVPMAADGGLSATNKAGAKYGTGYCDAQCPRDMKFTNGLANNEGWIPDTNNKNSGKGPYGACCSEMDIWEANSMASAVTPHTCKTPKMSVCTGDDCARNTGFCDADGCDINPYRMGNTTFYGPGKTIDTSKPVTVVTQFITADGTTTGKLSEIKRFFVQNGVTYASPSSNVAGISGNSITDKFCAAQKTTFGDVNYFAQNGGLDGMGAALAEGMVLVMSIWDDYQTGMAWLDSSYPPTAALTKPGVVRGPCAASAGKPSEVESTNGNAQVIYSNIKVGAIGSTFAAPA
ncbi:probable Probable 1,4-beta-D-glucan cellobiohydrolase A [Rhynchosporium graminicola]|uniref:Glucanase n=1 Tax=Rhynchosporium graminicola TaxID=2792576 RepID=A0A1E1L8M3_9HELO|nr:probable Probable 1,4-beta-D-glucan cellobiohydrolase A [Rhynchosporium commune]